MIQILQYPREYKVRGESKEFKFIAEVRSSLGQTHFNLLLCLSTQCIVPTSECKALIINTSDAFFLLLAIPYIHQISTLSKASTNATAAIGLAITLLRGKNKNEKYHVHNQLPSLQRLLFVFMSKQSIKFWQLHFTLSDLPPSPHPLLFPRSFGYQAKDSVTFMSGFLIQVVATLKFQSRTNHNI